MITARSALVIFVIHIYLSHSNASKGGMKQDFEIVLESIQQCKHPSPPYAKKVSVNPKHKIDIVNNMQYVSGNVTIIEPTQFSNFSWKTFAVDNAGKRVVKFQVSQVSCRNFFAKAVIKFSNVAFSSNNCILHKGVFQSDRINFNKVMHALPVWHGPGDVVHELQLVSDGATHFCTEVKVNITDKS